MADRKGFRAMLAEQMAKRLLGGVLEEKEGGWPIKSPSTEDKAAQQAGSYSTPWFGNVDARIGSYSQDKISQDTYDLMEADPVVGLALEIKTLALVPVEWSVSGPNPRTNAYVQAVLEPIMPSIIRNCVHRGAARGALPVELVWEWAKTSVSYVPNADPTDELVSQGWPELPTDAGWPDTAKAVAVPGSVPEAPADAATPASKAETMAEGLQLDGTTTNSNSSDWRMVQPGANTDKQGYPGPGEADDQGSTEGAFNVFPFIPRRKAQTDPIDEIVEGYRIAKFKPLSLKQVYSILMDGNENFAGFRCVSPNVDLKVEDGSCFLYVHNPWPSISPFYGQADLRRAYDAWYRKNFLDDCFMNYLQRFATPPVLVKFPEGSTGGVDNKTIADGIALSLSSGGAVTASIPVSDPTSPQWSIEIVTPTAGSNGHDVYQVALDYYNTQILRGMLMGDKTATTSGGASGMNAGAIAETHFDVFVMGEQGLLQEVMTAINKQIVPLIVRYTFGEDEPSPQVESFGIADKDKDKMMDLLAAALRGGASTVELDVAALAERYGVPIKVKTQEPLKVSETIQGTSVPVMPGSPQAEAPAESIDSAPVVSAPTDPGSGTASIDASEGALAAMIKRTEGLLTRDDLVQLADRVRQYQLEIALNSGDLASASPEGVE